MPIKCDKCKKEIEFGAAGSAPDNQTPRTALWTRIGGDLVGYAVTVPKGEGESPDVAIHCAACSGPEVIPKAREAGAGDRYIAALEINARLHGAAPAICRAIADILHDGRPVGNDRGDNAWKKLASAHAQARRLAEILAAPR